MTNKTINKYIDTYKDLSAQIRALEDLKKAAADKIRAALHECGGVYEEGKRAAALVKVTTNRIDTKALKAEAPDIYERYTQKTESERLNVR